eukprot:3813790-Rhodomonas_salina.1
MILPGTTSSGPCTRVGPSFVPYVSSKRLPFALFARASTLHKFKLSLKICTRVPDRRARPGTRYPGMHTRVENLPAGGGRYAYPGTRVPGTGYSGYPGYPKSTDVGLEPGYPGYLGTRVPGTPVYPSGFQITVTP